MQYQSRLETIVRSLIKHEKDRDLTPGPEESLFESGILDSFALADLVGAIEKEFGVSIPDSDLIPRKFDTISRIESYLNSRS